MLRYAYGNSNVIYNKIKNPVELKRYKNVKLLESTTSDGTKTSKGLVYFLFWDIMTSHESR